MSAPNGVDEKASAVRLMGRDELNTAEFPIALLNPQQARQVKTIECRRQIVLPSGQHLDQEWIVTGSDKYGLPLPGDQDVLLALIKIATDAPNPSPKVFFSRYEVLGILGWAPDGRNFRRVTDAIVRYWSARISTCNAFWNKERKEWTSHKGFSIIDSYEILERSDSSASTREQGGARSWAQFGQQFFDSLVSGYVKSLDLGLYLALHNNVTKRLYRYLDKHRYRRTAHTVALHTLAAAHIGFGGSVLERPATIKRALEPAHQELYERGFLREVSYSKASDGSYKVTYAFGEMPTVPEQPVPPPAIEEPADPLVQDLIARGVSPKNAKSLVAEKPHDVIHSQIEAFDYLLRLGTGKPIQNPAGFLTKAIQDGWTIRPPGFVSRQEREARQQARAQAAQAKDAEEAEEQRRKDEVEQVRDRLDAQTLAQLRAEAVEEVHRQFGRAFKIRDDSPVVNAFLNGMIRERYLEVTGARE